MRVSRCVILAALALATACSTDNSSPSPTCVVSVINISGAPASLQVGATAQLTANLTTQDCATAPTVTWSSSATGTATVSTSGLVTGVAEGPVTITATAGGKSATASITIEPVPVASVRVIPDSIVIGSGPAATLHAEALDDQDAVLSGRAIAWSSLTPGNATVSSTGGLTGVTEGSTATITATSEGQSGSAVVHVVRRRLAFFWNNQASPVGTVVPSTGYSYNSLGGALAIASSGTGLYQATFTGVGGAQHETEGMFVSAYSAPLGSFCRIQGWGPEMVNVNCHAPDGSLAAMRFDVAMVGSAAFAGRSGYAWIQDGSQTVTADAYYRYNPTGGEITSTFVTTGRYTVRFVGLGRVTAAVDREGVFVSSYGGVGGLTCQPASWTTTGADLDVDVRCFDATGTAANSAFTVLVVDGERPGARLGFAHADQPATATYMPTNAAVRPNGLVTVTRNGTGSYSVSFAELYRTTGLAETFLVTATGETPGRCNIGSWGYGDAPGTSSDVSVQCAAPDGTAADLPFSIVALQ